MKAAISPSRAADFKQCPLKFRFRTIDRLEEAPSPAAARGTLVHAVLEEIFELPAAERTPEAARRLVPGRWAALVAERPELADMLADDTSLSEQSWFAAAEKLTDRWFTLEDPSRLEPAEREVKVETEIGGLVLRGIIDRVDIAPTGQVRVVDYKTGRTPAAGFESKAMFQMKFYGLVMWRRTGHIPELLQLVYLKDGTIIRYEPDEADLLAVERNVRAVWAAIEQSVATRDFRPNPSKLCGWCDFKALCPAFGGTPPELPETIEIVTPEAHDPGDLMIAEAGEPPSPALP